MHETRRGRHSRTEPPAPTGPEAAWAPPVAAPPSYGGQHFASIDPWDPAEELAHLLQEAIAAEAGNAPLPDPHAVTVAAADDFPLPGPDHSPLTGLTEITAELPPVRPPSPSGRRRPRSRKRAVGAMQRTSFALAALAAVVVSMVCVFGGMVTYDPLRHLAQYRTSAGAVGWWPLLVYGPWMVASLSILRAALHQRRAAHSWAVVLVFSTVSMLLCVAQAPHTPVDAAAAALPSLAALACFQQLVRQITLTRPPRQTNPRHSNTPRPPKPTTSQPPKPI
ncbi:DUF2637 domain-containing protein [Streptomyces sp. NPDC054887]